MLINTVPLVPEVVNPSSPPEVVACHSMLPELGMLITVVGVSPKVVPRVMREPSSSLTVATTAPNGRLALDALKHTNVDVVLLDVEMPEMDGIELAQRCAEISPHTKVMFITGFAAVSLRASREKPTARVLSKPFHLRDLVLEVERVFEEAGEARV
jgi:two-component system cell cycle response regulator CpdR